MSKDLGWLWHLLGGAAICAAATIAGYAMHGGCWLGVVAVPVVGGFGYARELAQHDSKLTVHQWIEAGAWFAGAVLGFAGVVLFEVLR